jgi:hypothetical protein
MATTAGFHYDSTPFRSTAQDPVQNTLDPVQNTLRSRSTQASTTQPIGRSNNETGTTSTASTGNLGSSIGTIASNVAAALPWDPSWDYAVRPNGNDYDFNGVSTDPGLSADGPTLAAAETNWFTQNPQYASYELTTTSGGNQTPNDGPQLTQGTGAPVTASSAPASQPTQSGTCAAGDSTCELATLLSSLAAAGPASATIPTDPNAGTVTDVPGTSGGAPNVGAAIGVAAIGAGALYWYFKHHKKGAEHGGE